MCFSNRSKPSSLPCFSVKFLYVSSNDAPWMTTSCLDTQPRSAFVRAVRRWQARAGDGRCTSLDGGWHRRCGATGAPGSANPAKPGRLGHCAARQPRLPNPLARHRRTGRGGGVPPGVMAGGRHPKACIRIARPPGMFCPCIHDGGAIMRANAGHDRRRCKARAPLRA